VHLPSLYDLKYLYRRFFGRSQLANRIGRRFYHLYIQTRVSRYRNGVFRDKYGLSYNFDENSLLERQMAAAGYWEEDTRQLIESEISPGSVVIEVGANFGAHTLPIALKLGKEGRIYAFEPSDYGYDRLSQNIALNPPLKNIESHKLYVSRTVSAQMPVELTSYWTPTGEGNNTGIQTVRTGSLDGLFKDLSRLDLMKIDVDGADHDVLLSGKGLIARFHPKIYIEVSFSLAKFGTSPQRLCMDLQEYGYRLHTFSAVARGFQPVTVTEIEDLLHHQPVTNVLALYRPG
jgi:FkbM family methyltransferase